MPLNSRSPTQSGVKCSVLVRLNSETCTIDVVDVLLQRQHGELGHLVLRLVQFRAVEAW